jgi:ABC-type glycerol-3-phosphate transport system permease component
MRPRLAQTLLRYLVCVIAAALALAPLVWIVATSFKTQLEAASYPPTMVPAHPTNANYHQLFSSPAFLSSLLTSSLIVLFTTLLTLAVAFPCAYGLVRLRPYGRRPLILIIALAQTVPTIVFLIPMYSVAVQLGLYDTLPLIVVVLAAFLTPFATLTLAAFLRTLPVSVEEAGLVDGCTRLGVLWRIVLPMSRAPLAAIAALTGLYAWNEFLIPVILGGQDTVPLTVYVANFVTQKTIEWGPLTAAVCLVVLPAVAVVLAAQRQLVSGLTAGAVQN